MREILFRGKCVEVGIYYKRWLEGFYGVDDGKALIAHNTDFGLVGYFCDSDTIGQYTGLKDRNGTRVFEGDILIYEYDGEYDPDEKYLVAWDNDEAAFRVNYYLKGEYIHYESITPHQYFEIIGNIYDNPELLKGEQKNETTT